MLEKMLELAKNRKEQAAAAPPAGGASGYNGPAFTIKTFNAISPVGLKKFEAGKYKVISFATSFASVVL
jgi:D-3-phosphoglycerate dehydrogenase